MCARRQTDGIEIPKGINMFPASVGFSGGAVAQHSAVSKPEIPEQHFDNTAPQDAPEAQAALSSETAATVPATNSAPISVEAVTALQQVQEEQATTARNDVGSNVVEQNVASLQQQDQAQSATNVENVEVQRQENDAEQARVDARGEVPDGEETDTAGRSQRNPLDLQI